MGAWGLGAFENDAALDWSAELAKSDGLIAVIDALKPAMAEAVDIDVGERALAAAEVVAAARGSGDRSRLPDSVNAFLAAREDEVTAALVQLARKAVRRVATASELREMWLATEHAEAWLHETLNLYKRLEWSLA